MGFKIFLVFPAVSFRTNDLCVIFDLPFAEFCALRHVRRDGARLQDHDMNAEILQLMVHSLGHAVDRLFAGSVKAFPCDRIDGCQTCGLDDDAAPSFPHMFRGCLGNK